MPRVTEYGIKRIASPGLHVIQDILRWHKDGKDSCPANYWTWLDSVEELFLMADTRSPITAHWRRFHGQRPDVSSQGSQSNLRYWGFEQVK